MVFVTGRPFQSSHVTLQLTGPFENYKENEVLQIRPQFCTYQELA
jgi:hypothetical protein